MYRPISVDDWIATLPIERQKAIEARGKMLLARVERRMAKAQNAAELDALSRTKVQEALDDSHPGIPGEQVKAHFAKRRVTALSRKQK